MKTEKLIKLSTKSTYDVIGVNTEYGFGHIITEDDLTVQCCLMQRADGKGYKKEIKSGDCGCDDGICGDVNEKAFKKYGKETCLNTLFYHMRKSGVKIN